jgi:hypothetical protein
VLLQTAETLDNSHFPVFARCDYTTIRTIPHQVFFDAENGQLLTLLLTLFSGFKTALHRLSKNSLTTLYRLLEAAAHNESPKGFPSNREDTWKTFGAFECAFSIQAAYQETEKAWRLKL